MKLDLKYNTKENPVEITINLIQMIVNQTYKQDDRGNGGMNGQLARTYGRLQRKMDDVLENNKNCIELAEDEKDLLRKSIKNVLINPNIAKYFMIFEDEILKEVDNSSSSVS